MNNYKKITKVWNIIFLVCLVIILITGIFLKTFALYHSGNLFVDEGYLLSNIMERNYFDLFLPLNEWQCCPPMFLILGKMLYSRYGFDNFVLRILPYTFSVLSVIFFTFLSFKTINNKLGILLSISALSLSEACIMFQMYFKQYSSDAFFTIFVLLLAILLKDKKLSKLELFGLAILSCLVVFFSYTAGFLIVCVIIALLDKNIEGSKSNKEIKEKIKPFLCYIVPFSLIMTVFFFVNCWPTRNSDVLQDFWTDTYVFLPHNLFEIKTLVKFLVNPFSKIYPSLLIFAVTFFLLRKKDKYLWEILFLPFAIAIIFGYFKLYPLAHERVSTYLIPIFILILFKSIDFISFKNKVLSLFLISLVFFNINYQNVIDQYVKIFKGESLSIINDYKYIFKFKKEPISPIFFKGDCLYPLEIHRVTLFPEFLEILEHSDITENDYYVRDNLSFWAIADKKYSKVKINDKMRIFDGAGIFDKLYSIPKDSFVYFYLSQEYHIMYRQLKDWINKNCIVIYNVECYNGEFIKCKKIR